MISLLKRLFVDNWLRKSVSFFLALIIWIVLDHSLTTTKTVNTVSIKVTNVPKGKTVSGLQPSGSLNRRLSLTVTGKKSQLEEISSNDLEIVIDATQLASNGVLTIQKKHLVSLNPKLNIARHINEILPKTIVINLVPVAIEKIPIYISRPIGEAPKGFQFLDIWPYQLSITVKGPEDVIKRLKASGMKLTFNLNNITKTDLSKMHAQKDVVSFFIPEEWKVIHLPSISDTPLVIDDPEAKFLRVDFIRSTSIPLNFSIPINLFFPPDYKGGVGPSSIYVSNNDLVFSTKGIKILNKALYAKGVSELFIKIVKDMTVLSINMSSSNEEKSSIDASFQFINPQLLEDRYVTTIITEINDDELKKMHPNFQQEYLRNRFRNYMQRFELFTEEDLPFKLQIQLKGKELLIKEQSEQKALF